MLDEQPFGPFDRDPHTRTEPCELAVEISETGDVVRDAHVASSFAARIDDAELMVRAAPVDTCEHVMAFDRCCHR
jgi:hypothetical protein